MIRIKIKILKMKKIELDDDFLKDPLYSWAFLKIKM